VPSLILQGEVMPKLKLKGPFIYWRHGCWKEEYPAGVVEMDAEAAKAASACGLVDGPVTEDAQPGQEELAAKTNDWLRAELERRGVTVSAKAPKAELVELLSLHWANPVRA